MTRSRLNPALCLMILVAAGPTQVWSAEPEPETSSVVVVVDGMMKAKSGAT